MKDYWVITYVTYILLAVPAMVWVANTLKKNGQLFLNDVFEGDENLAMAVNKLLVVGFYMLNMGFIALFMKVGQRLDSGRVAMEMCFWKLGTVFLVLGGIHFFNVILLAKFRRGKTGQRHIMPPPARPQTPSEVRASYPEC